MRRRAAGRLPLLCLVPALLAVAGTPVQAAHSGTQSGVLVPGRIERDSRRFEMLDTAAFWEVLAIRPGMTIVDIGTGTGQFAYAFAARLQGRGKVYATDVNEGCVRYVQEQAAARGLPNLLPVLVRRDGPDAFYRSDTYDLIAMFHVLMDYGKESEFLRYLLGSLAADGRLVLVAQKSVPEFSAADFTADQGALAADILREPPGSPFHGMFPERTRRLLSAPDGPGSAGGLADAVAGDFNAALASPNFGLAFFDGEAFRKELDFTPGERAFAEWLALANNRQGVLRGTPHATWVTGEKARMINKLLILQRFRKFLRSGALFASGLSPEGRAAFARAGYVLQREYADLVPLEDVLVFARAIGPGRE